MNIKHCIKSVASLASVVLSSARLSEAVRLNASDLEVAFKLQARLDGVVGSKTVSFGSVSVGKTFRKFFSDKDTAILSALWSTVVAVDRAGEVLADLRPTPSILPIARLSAAEVAASFAAVVV